MISSESSVILQLSILAKKKIQRWKILNGAITFYSRVLASLVNHLLD